MNFGWKYRLIAALALVALPHGIWPESALAAEQNRTPRIALVVTSEPEVIVNGSPCLFRVESPRPLRSLKGKWQGRDVFFDFDASSGTWNGFAGVGIDVAAGQRRLTLRATTANGVNFSHTHLVKVERGDYRSVALRVPRRYTEPDPETLARIKEDQAVKKEVFARVTPDRLWSGSFATPIDSVVTSEFGVHRKFNRKVQSIHQGLDLRADTGTPVGAMNSGVVILAREMFYEGGFVVIDHGQGLLSLYMHLSEIKVNEGDSVAKSQIIALSGGTGRATAPHLHTGVRWQGVYLDPETLLSMQLP